MVCFTYGGSPFGHPPYGSETAAIGILRAAMQLMSALKARGCLFSLDDFGSGLSSFAYLKTLPVDFLKIDGGFIKNMQHDPIDPAIAEAIHRLGHSMSLITIVEAVEDTRALEALRALGVDLYPRDGDRPAESAESELRGTTHLRRAPVDRTYGG